MFTHFTHVIRFNCSINLIDLASRLPRAPAPPPCLSAPRPPQVTRWMAVAEATGVGVTPEAVWVTLEVWQA